MKKQHAGAVFSHVCAELGDYRNRLSSATLGGITTTYAYDPVTRVEQRTTGTTTRYIAPDYTLIGSTIDQDIYANGVLVGTVETKGASTTAYDIYTDHLGGTNVVDDENGIRAQTLTYAPFGSVEQNNTTSSFTEGKQYIGERYDSGPKLNYLNARYYEGSQGQFISQDPVFLEMGLGTPDSKSVMFNPQAMNSYSYAQNNPITNKDPDGRCGPLCVILWGLLTPEVAYAPDVGEEEQTAPIETAITVVGVVAPGARASKLTQLAENQAKGRVGEITSGIVKNTERIPSLSGTADFRIPDGLSHAQQTLSEVKNVANLSLTNQMKDFISYAKQTSYKLDLYVRSDTHISQPLQNALQSLESSLKQLSKKLKNDK